MPRRRQQRPRRIDRSRTRTQRIQQRRDRILFGQRRLHRGQLGRRLRGEWAAPLAYRPRRWRPGARALGHQLAPTPLLVKVCDDDVLACARR
jgi:hypothetical protein